MKAFTDRTTRHINTPVAAIPWRYYNRDALTRVTRYTHGSHAVDTPSAAIKYYIDSTRQATRQDTSSRVTPM